MKKEIRLAMLGIAIALGGAHTVEVVVAQPFPDTILPQQNTDTPVGTTGLTLVHIDAISECINLGDVLCLRAYLAAHPELLLNNDPFLTPWERNMYTALADFWEASTNATTRELLGELEVMLLTTGSIYG